MASNSHLGSSWICQMQRDRSFYKQWSADGLRHVSSGTGCSLWWFTGFDYNGWDTFTTSSWYPGFSHSAGDYTWFSPSVKYTTDDFGLWKLRVLRLFAFSENCYLISFVVIYFDLMSHQVHHYDLSLPMRIMMQMVTMKRLTMRDDDYDYVRLM